VVVGQTTLRREGDEEERREVSGREKRREGGREREEGKMDVRRIDLEQ